MYNILYDILHIYRVLCNYRYLQVYISVYSSTVHIVKAQKQPTRSSGEKLTKKILRLSTLEYHSALRMDKLEILVEKQIPMENIMLSKISQTHHLKYYMAAFRQEANKIRSKGLKERNRKQIFCKQDRFQETKLRKDTEGKWK